MRNQEPTPPKLNKLPTCAAEFIRLVINNMRYRRQVRGEVMAELTDHFQDALKDCETDDERENKAQRLVAEFGDAKLLAVLLRRAKKRCRPLWRTIAARTCQACLVFTICLVIYVGWFLTGKPNIAVDYVAVFNQMSRPEILDQDNAWPYYEKAIELYVEPNDNTKELPAFWNFSAPENKDFSSLSEAEQSVLREWVEKNEAAWKQVVEAALKPYLWRQYEVGSRNKDKWTMGILMPHLKLIRGLTRLGIWRARIEMEKGQVRQALHDCLIVARIGVHWQQRKTLIEYLTGLGVSKAAHEEILIAVVSEDLSDADLRHLHQQLSQMYPQSFPLVDMESDRLMLLDTIQQVFTDGGPGGGHLIPERFADLLRNVGGRDRAATSEFRSVLLSLIHVGRDETLAKGNELYDRLIEISKATPYEKRLHDYPDSEDLVLAMPEYRYFVLRSVPAFDNLQRYAYQCKALHEATLTVLALQRYRLENNEYPEKLDELITAGYLEQLPMDPYSDGPLVYARKGGNFLLYSVGPNFKDDGGQIGRGRYGQVQRWTQDDAVFGPVPE
ncbi:MAG: hypothetical protein ACYS29_09195 [Planctomycetota bacterium]|jgi:hypothetical protein